MQLYTAIGGPILTYAHISSRAIPILAHGTAALRVSCPDYYDTSGISIPNLSITLRASTRREPYSEMACSISRKVIHQCGPTFRRIHVAQIHGLKPRQRMGGQLLVWLRKLWLFHSSRDHNLVNVQRSTPVREKSYAYFHSSQHDPPTEADFLRPALIVASSYK